MKLDALKHPDLLRLRNDGYDIQLVGTHLLVKSVPYVTAAKEVRFDGVWVTPLELDADCTTPPKDHTAYFSGERPCQVDGQPVDYVIEDNPHELVEGVKVNFKFSYKRRDGQGNFVTYKDYYEKMTYYVKLLLHEARSLRPGDAAIRADTFPQVLPEDDNSPFEYEDTSASRAGIEALSSKLALDHVGILGLGGTGSYVLDLVAKTKVKNIHLFDDDEFHQHNAFRSPGATPKGELKPNTKKVDYFKAMYASVHKGIAAHPFRIDNANLDQLDSMSFVFLCLDSGEFKDAIFSRLEARGIPFVDVGMGVQLIDNSLQALIRVTTSTEGHRSHIRDKGRVSFAPADGDNIYRKNIQVADLNSFNAALAVMRWKKHFGFYADLEKEHHSVYVSTLHTLSAEDK